MGDEGVLGGRFWSREGGEEKVSFERQKRNERARGNGNERGAGTEPER